jgi:hypothetical protein
MITKFGFFIIDSSRVERTMAIALSARESVAKSFYFLSFFVRSKWAIQGFHQELELMGL